MEKSAAAALAKLEAKVHEASGELRRLLKENRELRHRLGGDEAEGAEDWLHEREEIRARLNRLAGSLEGLLREGG